MPPLQWSFQIAVFLFAPLAVGAVFSFLSAWLSGRNANKAAQRQNDLTAKMKLADFRQAWINQLRDTLSEFQSRAMISDRQLVELQELHRLAQKIRLLMNKDDANYGRLSNMIDLLISDTDPEGRAETVREATPLLQNILKAEWEVLKRDLSYKAPVG
jgi:hypothetical protein